MRTNAPVDELRPITTTFESAALGIAFFRMFVVIIFETPSIDKPRGLNILNFDSLNLVEFPARKRREKNVLATLSELSLQIVEFAREHGRVTMADAVKLTEANRNTLKQHFRNLVARGHLKQQGSGRGVWYGLG